MPQEFSWETLQLGKCALMPNSSLEATTGQINLSNKTILNGLRKQHKNYGQLDRSSLLALQVADQFENLPDTLGVNFGSSRGATGLQEQSISSFIESGSVPTTTSPNTTLGNLSSWVGHHIGSSGIQLSHSITCSTGLHAVLNGAAWIKSGLATHMLCGASEAPLTPYTLAQMKALKIYSKHNNDAYPCKSMVWKKQANSMVLGEAAAAVLIEQVNTQPLFELAGLGWGSEQLTHPANLSKQGICLQRSMNMAMREAKLEQPDAIILHAPGTIKGDLAEYAAIKACFGKDYPSLTSNKWAVGHSFATSGLLNLSMALYILQHNTWISNPLQEYPAPKKLNTILINAVGFGGNAVSLLIRKNG